MRCTEISSRILLTVTVHLVCGLSTLLFFIQFMLLTIISYLGIGTKQQVAKMESNKELEWGIAWHQCYWKNQQVCNGLNLDGPLMIITVFEEEWVKDCLIQMMLERKWWVLLTGDIDMLSIIDIELVMIKQEWLPLEH